MHSDLFQTTEPITWPDLFSFDLEFIGSVLLVHTSKYPHISYFPPSSLS
jgi:hypothetical protein